MLKKLLSIIVALIAVAILGFGANAQQSVQTIPGDRGPIVFGTTGSVSIGSIGDMVWGGSHLLSTGAAPTLTGCGGGSPTITGSDLSGTVVAGTTATGCIITFARAFAAAPACVLSPASGVLASFSYVTSASAITVTQTSTSGNTIQYICIGKQ